MLPAEQSSASSASSAVFLISIGNQTAEAAEGAEDCSARNALIPATKNVLCVEYWSSKMSRGW